MRLDLANMLDDLCERHLGRTLDVDIVWGSWPVCSSNWCFGYYWQDDDDEPQIVISPVLSLRWVPAYFLRDVVWHEACHAILHEQTGDWCADHTAEFTVLEALYPHHQKALEWERANLGRMRRAIARRHTA